jgi:predicted ATPase/class 3 adenylate cyclase/DNA-binding CsgD family transcriptional regulator
MADMPTGTVTFLFTDIEGSTRLWEQHPQTMAGALARHDAIMRQAIAAEAGVVYKVIGDAFQAAFTTAPAACAAALAAQRALTSEAWGVVGAVLVRMALHTCAAVPTDGDYSTGALNRLGRLLGAVHGGQIVLSRSTADLARETLPPDVTLRDLGERHLRDLRPEPIFQLVAPDLTADFPPLKTADYHPHNLPAQPTPLIGREKEIVTVCAVLRRTDVRLVTLTGPGGMGKTRLALQAAAALLDTFADGAWFVNLAPISDPHLVAATIAQTLGIKESVGVSLLDSLKDYLREKQLLLLLDNFEQIVDAAPLVSDLLAAVPGLKVLVTSRMPLHLAGEHEIAVPPLGLPPHPRPPLPRRGEGEDTPLPPAWGTRVAQGAGWLGDGGDWQHLTQYEAVRLFIERAQAVKAGFAVTNANAPAVAEICYRLDGLPLAIELAAVRVKLFPPQALLMQLGSRLRLLTGGARDLPARQQTIRNTIDWSYHLLDAGEQILFARLGVFVGGWTVEAAEAVCNAAGDLPIDVLDGLASLLDQSLLRQMEETDGEPHFTLLETIREYALERLVASGEAQAMQQRHAAYYLALAKTAEPQLRGTDQVAWMDRIEQEFGNLRAAIDWYHAQADGAEQELWLVGSLWTFWIIHCHFAEGRTRYEAALARPGDNAALAPALALALLGAGFLAHLSGRAQGAALGEQSLALYQQIGDQWGIALAFNLLGGCASSVHLYDPARATALLEESLKLSRLIEDPWCLGLAYQNLIGVYLWRENDERAKLLLEEYVMLHQRVRHPYFMAGAYLHLGAVEFRKGEYAKAHSYLQQSMVLYRELGDIQHVAHALHVLGNVATAQQDYISAASFYAESLAIRRELGEKLNIAWLHLDLGYLAFYRDDTDRALALFLESLFAIGAEQDKEGIAHCFVALGSWAVARGQAERGARLLGSATALLDDIDVRLQFEYRAVHTRTIAALHAEFDAAAFADAWASGRATPLEQMVAYALEPPPASTPPTAPQPNIAAGAYPAGLTAREVEVLRLVAQGLTDAQVAERLIVSTHTVHAHLRSIYGKLEVTSRTAATRFAVDHHLV